MPGRRIVRSEEVTWSASTGKSFNFEWLRNIPMPLAKVDIEWLRIAVEYTITPAASTTAYGKDFARTVAQWTVKDIGGERCNLKGTSLRVMNQRELGDRFHDPADSAEATATSGTLYLYLPFSMFNRDGNVDARDSACPALALLPGSSYVKMSSATIVDSGANDVTLTSATFYIEAKWKVRRGRRPECPVRVCYRDEAWTAAEQYFPINGSLRDVYCDADKGDAAASGKNAWSLATYNEIDSATLGYTDMDSLSLLDEYRLGRALSSVDNFIQTTNTGLVILVADPEDKIADLPDVGSLHIKLPSAAPSNGVAIFSYIPDVPDAFAAKALGVPAGRVAELRAKRGLVATRDGRKVSAGQFGNAAKRLPIKLDTSAGA